MKIKILSLVLLGATFLLASCNKKAEEDAEPAVQEITDFDSLEIEPLDDTTVEPTEEVINPKDNDMIEVTGKVTEINQGKDGYSAKITTADNKIYSATISIPNLDNPKQYRMVKAGDMITVKGSVTNLESDVLIRVKELK